MTHGNMTKRALPEITPAMIDAGLNAYYEVDPRFNSEEDRVAAIFRAMAAQRDLAVCPTESVSALPQSEE